MFFSKLKLGSTYACQTGIHAGKLLIFMESKGDDYAFLSVPTMENALIPKKEFDFGLNNSIIEYVERVPKEVRKVTQAQYKSNEK